MATYDSNEFGAGLKTRRAAFEWGPVAPPTPSGGIITLTNDSSQLVEYSAAVVTAIRLPEDAYVGAEYHLCETAGNASVVSIDGQGTNVNGAASVNRGAAYAQTTVRRSTTQWIIIHSRL